MACESENETRWSKQFFLSSSQNHFEKKIPAIYLRQNFFLRRLRICSAAQIFIEDTKRPRIKIKYANGIFDGDKVNDGNIHPRIAINTL